MTFLVASLWRNQRGQDFTEYALIAGLLSSIAVGIVPEMLSIGGHINSLLLSATQAAANITTLK
jgi:Flp pilus assembly pilin Flp